MADVQKYYQAATNLELQNLEGANSNFYHMVQYIPEYEFYLWIGGGVGGCGANNFKFGCSGPDWIKYVRNKTNLGGNRVMLEVEDFDFRYERYYSSNRLSLKLMTFEETMENFILRNIQTKKFLSMGKTYYLMHQENGELYFRARSDKPFN